MNRMSDDYVVVAFAPCPFCGNTPNVFQVRDDRYVPGEMNWVVECKQMGCMFNRSTPNRSLSQLAQDWNQRSQS